MRRGEKDSIHLTERLPDFLPGGPGCLLSTLFFNQVLDIEVTATGVQVHLVSLYEGSPVPDLVRDIESDDNGCRKVRREEAFYKFGCRHFIVSDRGKTNPELGDKDKDVEEKAHPGSINTDLGFERQFVQGVALSLPAFAETDMS